MALSTNPMDWQLRVEMPDGPWDVPVKVIAEHRAANYADEFDNDVQRSLDEDTLPLFRESPFEAEDWAANNMDWDDVKAHAVKAPFQPDEIDYVAEWCNAEKSILRPVVP
jgi:hypothetical protein